MEPSESSMKQDSGPTVTTIECFVKLNRSRTIEEVLLCSEFSKLVNSIPEDQFESGEASDFKNMKIEGSNIFKDLEDNDVEILDSSDEEEMINIEIV